MDALRIQISPAVRQWSFENLGDDPTTHRWRAAWSFTWDGYCDGINLTAHPVLKATRCGAWISQDSRLLSSWTGHSAWEDFDPGWMKKRLVMDDSMQAWAKPTREAAMHSLAVRLTRWATNIRKEVEKARDAARTLIKLRPDDAFLGTAALGFLTELKERG